mgnify:CR=1 FL=1|jgi:hypothetical protein
MKVLEALTKIDVMSYEQIQEGFNNVRNGIREYLMEEHDIVDIIIFLEDKLGMSLPVCVNDQVELAAYISGYAKCMSAIVANGMCRNFSVTFAQNSEFLEELTEYREEFVESVTNALVTAYKHKCASFKA